MTQTAKEKDFATLIKCKECKKCKERIISKTRKEYESRAISDDVERIRELEQAKQQTAKEILGMVAKTDCCTTTLDNKRMLRLIEEIKSKFKVRQ